MSQPWSLPAPDGVIPSGAQLRSISWSVELNESPPSVNELYTTFRGSRILTSNGRRFQSYASEVVRKICESDPEWHIANDLFHTYGGWVELSVTIHMPPSELVNKSWLVKRGKTSKTKQGATRIPYQRRDTSNMTKIVEDSVALGTGIDDAAHAAVNIRRLVSTTKNLYVTVNYLLVFAIE
jgi:Holliday junction resolvase RusA-like endonuclease